MFIIIISILEYYYWKKLLPPSCRARSKAQGCRSGSKAPARRALDHAPDGVEQVRGVDDQATECQTSQVVAHGHNLRRLDAMQPPLVRMQLLDKLRKVPDQKLSIPSARAGAASTTVARARRVVPPSGAVARSPEGRRLAPHPPCQRLQACDLLN